MDIILSFLWCGGFVVSASGRGGGRTPEGGPRPGNRRGSQGRPVVTRSAQNFVSFDYAQLEGRRGSAMITPVSACSLTPSLSLFNS